jgi:hypothetical protein
MIYVKPYGRLKSLYRCECGNFEPCRDDNLVPKKCKSCIKIRYCYLNGVSISTPKQKRIGLLRKLNERQLP